MGGLYMVGEDRGFARAAGRQATHKIGIIELDAHNEGRGNHTCLGVTAKPDG